MVDWLMEVGARATLDSVMVVRADKGRSLCDVVLELGRTGCSLTVVTCSTWLLLIGVMEERVIVVSVN